MKLKLEKYCENVLFISLSIICVCIALILIRIVLGMYFDWSFNG